MSLFIASLNSGSNGNCYYIGNDREAVLVDVGISCREIEKRLRRLKLSMEKVKAIFISHEHGDHIRGLTSIASKHKLPIYITPLTLRSSRLYLDETLVVRFEEYKPIQVGNLLITAFPKQHDGIDPHSFIISCNDINVGVLTDIGAVCEHVVENFSKCHAVFLESNYDATMLESGRYPYPLKNRIRGGKGHLSNLQALDLFLRHRPPFMSHLILSHLSKDNNKPELVADLFNKYAEGIEVIVASRESETEVYQVGFSKSLVKTVLPPMPEKVVQASLF